MTTMIANSYVQEPHPGNLIVRIKSLWMGMQHSAPKSFANQSHLPKRMWQRHSALISASRQEYRLR